MRGKLRKLSSQELKFIKDNVGKRKNYEVAQIVGIHASQLCRLKERIVKSEFFNIDKEWKKNYGTI